MKTKIHDQNEKRRKKKIISFLFFSQTRHRLFLKENYIKTYLFRVTQLKIHHTVSGLIS